DRGKRPGNQHARARGRLHRPDRRRHRRWRDRGPSSAGTGGGGAGRARGGRAAAGPAPPERGVAGRRGRAPRGRDHTPLGLEIRRLLRNRGTVIFALVIPAVFFLLFGLNNAYAHQRAGHGNVSAFILASMALYGAVLATTSGGAMVSIERAAGWSRQLRI